MQFEIQTIVYAILGGALPAIGWLWFWIHQEDENHEPLGLIVMSFITGSLLVFFAIALERFTFNLGIQGTAQIIIWAAIEELLKLAGFAVIMYGHSSIDEPIDYPMYLIAVALGFAALENVLYLLKPELGVGTIVSLFTGNLRFLGSTLLHAIASSMIGSAIALSVYLNKNRALYLFFGITAAIVLHSVFNFFIMDVSGKNFLSVFGFLWIVAIINILIFEKLKRIGS